MKKIEILLFLKIMTWFMGGFKLENSVFRKTVETNGFKWSQKIFHIPRLSYFGVLKQLFTHLKFQKILTDMLIFDQIC